MQFRKKPVVIDAVQWFKLGDHPAVVALPPERFSANADPNTFGYIDTLEGGHIVTPGDWIITGVKGEQYPVKPEIFEATYEDASIADPAEAAPERAPWPTAEQIHEASGHRLDGGAVAAIARLFERSR